MCVSGGLADREDERSQLHGVIDARRHASEGEGVHHEGVQIRSQVTQPDQDQVQDMSQTRNWLYEQISCYLKMVELLMFVSAGGFRAVHRE